MSSLFRRLHHLRGYVVVYLDSEYDLIRIDRDHLELRYRGPRPQGRVYVPFSAIAQLSRNRRLRRLLLTPVRAFPRPVRIGTR